MTRTPLSRLVVLGAGGDAVVVAEAIRQITSSGGLLTLAGFLDDSLAGTQVDGLPVFGRLDDWQKLDADICFIPAIQKVGDMPKRASRLEGLRIPAERWGQVIHPRAVVAQSAEVGKGVYIAACATVQPGCKIGDFATLRAGAALGHDSTVERHAYVGPNATLCGRSVLSEGAHLSPNSVILDNRIVGRFSVVGIGTAVTKNVPEFNIVMGNPARRIGRVKPLGATLGSLQPANNLGEIHD